MRIEEYRLTNASPLAVTSFQKLAAFGMWFAFGAPTPRQILRILSWQKLAEVSAVHKMGIITQACAFLCKARHRKLDLQSGA